MRSSVALDPNRKNDQAAGGGNGHRASMALQLMDTFTAFVDSLADSLDDHEARGEDLAARAYLSRFHFDRVVS